MLTDILGKNERKYLVFNSADENKEVLKKYGDVWSEIKNRMNAINDIGENNYEKYYVKVRFDSDDLIIRSIFE